LTYQVNRFIFY